MVEGDAELIAAFDRWLKGGWGLAERGMAEYRKMIDTHPVERILLSGSSVRRTAAIDLLHRRTSLVTLLPPHRRGLKAIV